MRTISFLCALAALGASLAWPVRAEEAAVELIGPAAAEIAKAEAAFSAMSQARGAEAAFDFYLAPDALEASPDKPSPERKAQLLESLRDEDAAGVVLTWRAIRAESAASGDLGYTFGRCELRKKVDGTLVAHGYFTTIWKKVGGEWKAIFDIGNDSPLEAK